MKGLSFFIIFILFSFSAFAEVICGNTGKNAHMNTYSLNSVSEGQNRKKALMHFILYKNSDKIDALFEKKLNSGNPADIEIKDITVKKALVGYELAFSVENKNDRLNYHLELIVNTRKNKIQKTIYITKKIEQFSLVSEERPISLSVDSEYKTPRYPDRNELNADMSGLFSDHKKAVFINRSDMPKYKDILDRISNAEVYYSFVTPYDKTDKILIFLGCDNEALKKMFDEKDGNDSYEFMAKAYRQPGNSSLPAYLIDAADRQQVMIGFESLQSCLDVSLLRREQGKNFSVADKPSAGINHSLYNEKQGVKVQKALSVRDIVDENKNASVFYIGETHTNFAHHENQLEFIKTLFESGRKVAVGLEMVQYPFQKHLDDYINGRTDEKTMLKNVEYYERWRYDFRLYRSVFEYAKNNGIKLVALNTPKEITQKISKSGLKSLTESELKQIPDKLSFTDERYRGFLYSVYQQHKMGSFDNFYEAQVIWDETMASKAAEFCKDNPDTVLVVLAGSGHIRYGAGIPERQKRRNSKPYVTVLQDEKNADGIADYILYPDETEFEESPKLGIALTPENDRLVVGEITEKSAAESAGIKKEDVLLKFNDTELKTLADLKLELLYASKGAESNLTVLRKGEKMTLKIRF